MVVYSQSKCMAALALTDTYPSELPACGICTSLTAFLAAAFFIKLTLAGEGFVGKSRRSVDRSRACKLNEKDTACFRGTLDHLA